MTDDLDRMRLLHAVASAGTIAGAARHEGVTASAVSQQIALLERHVGVALLERTNRGVTLTDAGSLLSERASETLDAVRAAFAAAAEAAAARTTRTVRVAAFPTAVTEVLLPALEAHAHALPRVAVVHLEPDAALVALRDRAVDLAIVDRYGDVAAETGPAAIDRRELFEDALRLVIPLGWDDVTALADLASRAFVLGSPGTRLGRVGRALAARTGADPVVLAETDDHHLAFRIAAARDAATVQPALALADLPGERLRTSALDLGVSRTLELVRRSSTRGDPLVRDVGNAILETVGASPW